MKPQPATSIRPTSERRAVAARANGAKSRGPVTTIGKANSSRNSLRHGLRSQTLLVDAESGLSLTAILASLEREFQPQSQIERTLIGSMALASWRRTCIRRLESSVINREVRRLKSLIRGESPIGLAVLAFQSLSGEGGSLDLIGRIESRCDRQFDLAFDRLTAHQARRAQSSEKVKTSERSQQLIENTQPRPAHATLANPN